MNILCEVKINGVNKYLSASGLSSLDEVVKLMLYNRIYDNAIRVWLNDNGVVRFMHVAPITDQVDMREYIMLALKAKEIQYDNDFIFK